MIQQRRDFQFDSGASRLGSGSNCVVGRCRRQRHLSNGRTRMVLLVSVFIVVAAGALIGICKFFAGGPSRSPVSFQDALLVRDSVTLSPRVHLLGRCVPSVPYAIETSEGLVLIDAGLDADASRLREQLVALGLNGSRIRAILLTHVHGDHTQGARYLRESTGAKIYAGQGDCTPIRDGGPREAIFSTFPMEGFVIHGTPVDVELKGGEELVFGDTKIDAIATPGHTPGSMCYLLQRDKEHVLFGGDTISSLIADLGTYSAYLPPRYRGNARDYLGSLRKLRAIPTPDLVLPGHPNEQGQPHSPRLSESAWHDLLDRGIQDMETLVARYDTDGEDFLDDNPKELLKGLYYLGDYMGRAVYVLHTGTHQLLIDAPGDDGLVSFVTERLHSAGIDTPALSAVLLTSGDSAATAGLAAINKTWYCRVVAASAAHEAVRAACADSVQLMTPDELAKTDWLTVQTIPLAGCGLGTVAYLIRWEQRDVLVSGSAPCTLGKSSTRDLVNILQGSQGDPQRYKDSLLSLQPLSPNLWLPAHPTNGQNANIYGVQWSNTLQWNRQLLPN